jgi:hypothetical protein
MPKKTDKQLASLIAEAESDKIKELKNTNERLLRQIDKLKDKKADLIEAVYQGARDGMSTLTLPKISKSTIPNKKTKDTELCVPLLSDIQLAKRTPDYDSKIAEKRVIEYANRIVKLTKIQRQSHNVNKCVVLALGDIVEGELIFPGQSHLIDSSLYRQVTVDGPRILYAFFTTLLQEFDEVLDTMFANEKRIKFHIPEGVDNHWYTVADLGVKAKFFCFHGDNIRGSMGLPFYGYNKKILGWKALASQGLMENFTHAVCGHYHTPTSLYINDVRVWVNGSTESYNSYAQEQLASMGRPSQFCLFVKPSKGVTAEYLVNLEE